MSLIIISGLIGSGKSTLSKFFKTKGYHYLNSDKIVKNLIEDDQKIKNKLFKLFDKSIFIEKRISIKKLREVKVILRKILDVGFQLKLDNLDP